MPSMLYANACYGGKGMLPNGGSAYLTGRKCLPNNRSAIAKRLNGSSQTTERL